MPLRAPPEALLLLADTAELFLAPPETAEEELLDAEETEEEELRPEEDTDELLLAELPLLLLPEETLLPEDTLPEDELLEEVEGLLMVPPTAREEEDADLPTEELLRETLPLERLTEAEDLDELPLERLTEPLLRDEEEEELLLPEELPLLDWALSVHGAIASETAATAAIANLKIAFIMLNFSVLNIRLYLDTCIYRTVIIIFFRNRGPLFRKVRP